MSPRKIKDRFSKIESPQVRYQKRMIARGLCQVCGEKRGKGSLRFCPACLVKHRLQVKAWRAGFEPYTRPDTARNGTA